jgi:NAD(P)-dependent dehydrogenase (short-subunit alcohol dehydrogenase family)
MSQVWLITDAGRGPGRTLAEAVLRAGGQVVAGAREPVRLAALARRYTGRLCTVEFDVTDEATVYAAIDAALAAFGRLDVVINNAGQADLVPIEEMTDTDLREQFEANFFGHAGVIHAVLPILREQAAGRFVQVARHDDGCVRGTTARTTAQAALRRYFESLAREVAPVGIDVDVVEPGELLAGTIGSAAAERLRMLSADIQAAAPHTKPLARVARLPARPEAA